MTNHSAPLIISSGEPAGVGPDIIIQWAQEKQATNPVVLGNADLFTARAEQLGLPLTLVPYSGTGPLEPQKPGHLCLLDMPLPAPCKAGTLAQENAPAVIAQLERAAKGCLTGEFSGLVTAPVHKGIINEAGIPFQGHTEFFANLAGVNKVVMMLATNDLRVALVTTHLPLAHVPSLITTENLEQTLTILHHSLVKEFGITNPVIGVCGLNPHAGEQGHLGTEEIEIITPVIERLRGEGLQLEGPLPADTIFAEHHLAQLDVVLAMYHDQGLPVLKHKGFGKAVNVTLGLPFVRTSVDHGTALPLAGTGKAQSTSLTAAIAMAQTLSQPS